MSLRDFVNERAIFYNDDIKMIIDWASENKQEEMLIKAISNLASSMARDKKEYEHRTWEWSYYAYSVLVPKINDETDDAVVLNAIRLAYMASKEDIEVYKFIEKLLDNRKDKKMILEAVKDMHYEIWKSYMTGAEMAVNEDNGLELSLE